VVLRVILGPLPVLDSRIQDDIVVVRFMVCASEGEEAVSNGSHDALDEEGLTTSTEAHWRSTYAIKLANDEKTTGREGREGETGGRKFVEGFETQYVRWCLSPCSRWDTGVRYDAFGILSGVDDVNSAFASPELDPSTSSSLVSINFISLILSRLMLSSWTCMLR
jgi:hypothetical protein